MSSPNREPMTFGPVLEGTIQATLRGSTQQTRKAKALLDYEKEYKRNAQHTHFPSASTQQGHERTGL